MANELSKSMYNKDIILKKNETFMLITEDNNGEHDLILNQMNKSTALKIGLKIITMLFSEFIIEDEIHLDSLLKIIRKDVLKHWETNNEK